MKTPAAVTVDVAPDWHAITAEAAMRLLAADPDGLTVDQARERLVIHGPNEIPQRPPPSLAAIFLRQFKSPLIYVLGAAAALAAALDDLKDAIFILIVLLINATLGAYQERRAERSSHALRRLLKIRASVSRSREVAEIDAEGLVPGDLVWLESGNRVPADLRLVEASGLDVDESLLTGESALVHKDARWMGLANTPLAERRNLAFAGTMVARGRARGVVVATAALSAIGEVAMEMLDTARGKAPLVARMEVFSRRIGAAVVVAGAAVAAFGILAHGHAVGPMLLFAIALVVSAIPEGLPVALTAALAVASHRMAIRRVIVRELAAVEGLGSCTLIASDKTGTLTVNELTAKRIVLPEGAFEVEGEGFAPEGEIRRGGRVLDVADRAHLDALLRASVLCNEGSLYLREGAWAWHGDPTDIALLAMAHKAGLTRGGMLAEHPQVASIPFEPERRYAASFHSSGAETHVFVKGAPERVARMCAQAGRVNALLAAAERLARNGFRVLALATGRAEVPSDGRRPEPSGLELLGLIGMIDPLRDGAADAVRTAHDAGVATVMITGDHPLTALAIARDLGLAETMEQVVTGAELADMGSAEIGRLLPKVRVFARVSPHQKLDIVRAAQDAGHFVAVTGDGVNDAPALRAANIGVAMGRGGTDTAREAAALVIADDHFATITAGIEEGRIAYDNIRKVVFLSISTGAAEVLVVALAIVAGLPLPLLPAQLLWLNLVTNGIQDIALGFEPGEPGVLKRAPRAPTEPLFDRLMVERSVIAALVMGGVGFFLYQWLLAHEYSESAARNELLLLMVLFENLHVLSCRSERVSAFRVSASKSPVLLLGIAVVLSIHVAMMYIPLAQALLGTGPVSIDRWFALAAMAGTVLAVMELHKFYWRRRRTNANGDPVAFARG